MMPSQKQKPVENDDELDWSDEEGIKIDDIVIPAPVKTTEVIRSETRLVITKIRNSFFKSYAEETTLGPFCESFNAVVGPNGSGKSNVIDSILFVFGYRATKIRLKKLSGLIHNSEKYPNVQSCYVAVHFCEIKDTLNNKSEVVSGSEFFIQRTANRDNSSYYLINQRRVHFKEIGVMLNKFGIDLRNNRFLILQGEVEEIALMKPKGITENETGMLEYLEEIIGTKRYKNPLLQINERIDLLTENRLQKLNHLQVIKNDLEKLKEPMEAAITFLKEENKIAHCNNFLYQKNIFDLEEKVAEITTDKEKITTSLDGIKEKLKELSEQKREKEDFFKQENAKFDGLNKEKEKLKTEFDESDKKDVQLVSEMKQLNTNRKKNKEQLVVEQKKLEKLMRIPEENEKSIAEMEGQEMKLVTEKDKLEEEKSKIMANIRSETKHLTKQKEDLDSQLLVLKQTVSNTKAEYDVAKVNLEMSTTKKQNAKEKLVQITEKMSTVDEKLNMRTKEVNELKTKIPTNENLLLKAKKELDEIEREQANISDQFNRNRITLAETRSSMEMSSSRSRILDVLMEQKRLGNCPGLLGRLGDLGAIDKKYDVAISTACGPLDNLVVDTVTTAQWCIEYLKSNNIGRVTIIALEKQEHLRDAANAAIRTPENVYRLFDLIKFQDENVKTAFYYGLRNTLVADTIEQASRIAYGEQRFRVVTLKGELIETSGTMSGGGRASRGRMGQAIVMNAADVNRMKEQLQSLKNRLDELNQRERQLNDDINRIQPELAQQKNTFNTYLLELEHLKAEKPEILQQIENQKTIVANTKTDQNQIDQLSKILEMKAKAFDDVSQKAEHLQKQVHALTAEIDAKSTEKLRFIDEKINETKKKLNKTKSEISRFKVQITTNTRNVTNTENRIKHLEQSTNEAETKLRQMKAERDEMLANVEIVLKRIEVITQELETGQEEFGELKNELNELTKRENELKMQRVDINQTVKVIQAKLDQTIAHIHQWTAKLRGIKLQIIPEETMEPLPTYTAEEIAEKNPEVFQLDLEAAQNNVKNAKPNLTVLEEYNKQRIKFIERQEEVDQVTEKRNSFKRVKDELIEQRRIEFMGAFHIIKSKLKEMYQMITLGGDADLDILDSFDPFNEGIRFSVRPPKKSWKTIMQLSGGEKTLSSLAFVFALHHYKPSPLYVMDEIDAALDFKNVSIIGHYIKERTKNSQFIIISLRENMFELATYLIGIYKLENCTRTIALDAEGFSAESEEPNLADKENIEENAQDTEMIPV